MLRQGPLSAILPHVLFGLHLTESRCDDKRLMFRRLGSAIWRNVFNMASVNPIRRPDKPLIIVLGSTGTGKSEVGQGQALGFRPKWLTGR